MSLNREEVGRRICEGASIFIYRGRAINATSWEKQHPGGELSIKHFVGRDATDEVEAYHSPLAQERLVKYAMGTVDVDAKVGWRPYNPPIAMGLTRHPDGIKGHWMREGAVRLAGALPSADIIILTPEQLEPVSTLDAAQEKARSDAYHQLKSRITEARLFERPGPLGGYGSDLIRYALLGSLAFGLHLRTSGWLGQMLSATFLGLFYHQLTFLAHDAGHTGVTGKWWWDRVIGMVVANWIGGLSLGWWCNNHNIHHLVTNHPEHDPDIQHIPFFAISKDFFGSLWSTYYKRVMSLDAFARAMVPLQHKLYYLVLSLARFNLYANSYAYLASGKPKRDNFWRFEIAGVAFYWLYFGAILSSLPTWGMRLAYILVSHVVASPVHVQIVLSHFACSTEDLGPAESFASRQLRTTMDVICSPEIEFLHGGLHLQVTHHLFPRLPRHHLRAASLLVKEYCQEQDILYREHGFVDGNKHVLSVLEDVAKQLEFIKLVADKEIEGQLDT